MHEVLPNDPLSVLPAEANVKNFSHKDLRGFARMGSPLFEICSLFFVMCQKVKRRLVVRSNDDRRHSTTIFSENVAVTEISKQIIEVLSFLRSGESLTSFNKTNLVNFLVKKQKQNKTKKNSEAFRDEQFF